MATPISASDLLAALRAEGLVVREVGDWRTRNRNHVGAWGPVYGVMVHHTVTSGAAKTVAICRDGHSSLPGPLCHGVITKDGVVHLVGHGRTNHAGSGDGDVLQAVIAERALPADNEANTDGNRHFYGFECENLGDGKDPWPEAQLDAIARAAAALCRHHGWSARSVIGHLEWQPGKVDPRGFSMADMRERIARRLAAQPTPAPAPKPTAPAPKPTPVEEGPVQLGSQVELGAWVARRWPDDTGLQDGRITVRTALGSTYGHARASAENTEHLLALVNRLAAEVAALRTDVSRLIASNIQG